MNRVMTIRVVWLVADPVISIIIPVWDALDLTRRCVESIRANTHVTFELVGVDNGSRPDTAMFVVDEFDVSVRNETNLGFAVAMNQGLERARGEYVAYLNNDTEVPDGWASTLLEHFQGQSDVGLVVPAVSAAGNYYSVRDQPGDAVITIPPFSEIPSGVAYVMPANLTRALGGWSEEYAVASSEDLDLLFTVWSNGKLIVLDERVFVIHASAASASRLPNRDQLWRRNRAVFISKWSNARDASVPRISGLADDAFFSNLEAATLAAIWMGRWFAAKDELADAHALLEIKAPRHRSTTPRGGLGRIARRLRRLAGRG